LLQSSTSLVITWSYSFNLTLNAWLNKFSVQWATKWYFKKAFN
jgi:hypothetical protein